MNRTTQIFDLNPQIIKTSLEDGDDYAVLYETYDEDTDKMSDFGFSKHNYSSDETLF